MDNTNIMIGARALYGDCWIACLAADCGWNRRFIERIASGRNEAPAYVGEILEQLLEGRLATIRKIDASAPEEFKGRLVARIHELKEAAALLAAERAVSAA